MLAISDRLLDDMKEIMAHFVVNIQFKLNILRLNVLVLFDYDLGKCYSGVTEHVSDGAVY